MQNDETPAAALRRAVTPGPFVLVSVEKTDGPQGGVNQQWYSYVLDNGRSQIKGQQSGSVATVTAYATNYATELNARVVSGHSTWSPRGKKPYKPAVPAADTVAPDTKS